MIRPGVGLRATGPRPLLSPPLGFLFWAMSAEQVFEPTSLPTPKKYNSPLSGQYLFSPLPLAYLSRAMSAEQVFEPSFSPTRKNIISSVRADASSLTSTWLTFLGRCRPGKFLNRLFHRPLKNITPPFRADTSSLASPWLTFLGRCRPSRFLNRLVCRPLKNIPPL